MIGLFFGIIAVVVATDLITKFTIDGILNPGISWGLGAQFDWLWIVIVVASVLIVSLVVVWFLRTQKRTWLGTVGLALFVGGVLGNALDRLVSGGAVHDFIDFVIFKNNLADIAITVGAVLVMIAMIVEGTRAHR